MREVIIMLCLISIVVATSIQKRIEVVSVSVETVCKTTVGWQDLTVETCSGKKFRKFFPFTALTAQEKARKLSAVLLQLKQVVVREENIRYYLWFSRKTHILSGYEFGG